MIVTLFIGVDTITGQSKEDKHPSSITKSASVKHQETAAVHKQSSLLSHKILNVPLINQLSEPDLYNGCEVTSLAMILNYSGYHITKNELAENIKTVPLTYQNNLKGNPNEGFVGDMDDGPGLGVYNGPIYDLAKKYAGNKVENLTGSLFTELLKKVNDGEPVWVITTTTMAPVSDFEEWKTPQGTIKITYNEHSVVMTGYDARSIYINDPYGEKNKKVDRTSFEKAWKQMGKQAIVIEK